MNCPNILELQSLVDRQISPSREQALKVHVAACPSCREQVEALRTMAEALHAHTFVAAVPEALPQGLQERLLQAVATAPPVRHLSCRKVLPQLTAYLDGELSEATTAAIEAHTFTCEKCFTALSELRIVTETLAARQRAVPSEQLLARIMVALRREAATARVQERRWLPRVAWQPVAAGLAAAVVLAAVIFPRLSPTPTWQPPLGPAPMMAARPAPEASTPAVTAQPDMVTSTPATVQPPSALTRLSEVFTGNRQPEATVVVGPKPTRGAGPKVWPWGGRSSREALQMPDGGPVVASDANALPAVAPVNLAGERVAALPTATPGLAEGDDQPRARVASMPTEKPRPSDIALAPRSAPAPELVPRRSVQPAWEIYRSEGVDRERLAPAAQRLTDHASQVRMAFAKNFVIIH